MKCYYAHSMGIYNSEQEKRDIRLLEFLGFFVINPNNPEAQAGAEREGMRFFERYADECNLIAFRAHADGSIPAGVAEEIEFFRKRCKPVIELPSNIMRRTLDIPSTRLWLEEVGQR
jgi:hypothetical protein